MERLKPTFNGASASVGDDPTRSFWAGFKGVRPDRQFRRLSPVSPRADAQELTHSRHLVETHSESKWAVRCPPDSVAADAESRHSHHDRTIVISVSASTRATANYRTATFSNTASRSRRPACPSSQWNGAPTSSPTLNGNGAPCRSRTCGLKIRSLVLYPAELRARAGLRIAAV